MRIIARATLKSFWLREPAAQKPLEAWFAEASAADWRDPMDIKARHRSASILRDGRVVFNIGGNKYRLVTWINYSFRILYICFIGTHQEYDRIDAQTI